MSEELKKLELTVKTGEEAAEIFIIDSQFQRIANDIGKKASFKLSPGLYTVKIRLGSEYEEKSVALLIRDELVSFPRIPFSTPAPLKGTAQTPKSQIDNAIGQSIQVHVFLGEGSQIYIFARNGIERDGSTTNATGLHPCTGLSLRNMEDDVLVDFGSPDTGVYKPGAQPWSACNVELDPGVYCLCLTTASGKVLRQSIVASQDWQSQIFLLQRNYDVRLNDTGVDLTNGSIFMARMGHGFQSSRPVKYSEDPDFHLTEMARQALINNRPVLGKEVVPRVLNQRFSNPMLGIYAAHLLLLDEKSDKSVLPAVITKLRSLFADPHPDIEAIAQKLNLPGNYIFNMPPMLHSSWNYLLEASVARPFLVPENSVASGIAGQAWSGNPWLLWGYSENQPDNTGILSEQLKKLTKLGAASIDPSNLAPDQLMATKVAMPPAAPASDLQPMPQPAAERIQFNAPAHTVNDPAPELNEPAPAMSNPALAMNDDQILHLVQALGVPRLKLEALMKNIDLE